MAPETELTTLRVPYKLEPLPKTLAQAAQSTRELGEKIAYSLPEQRSKTRNIVRAFHMISRRPPGKRLRNETAQAIQEALTEINEQLLPRCKKRLQDAIEDEQVLAAHLQAKPSAELDQLHKTAKDNADSLSRELSILEEWKQQFSLALAPGHN